jgi:phosphoenolpyruvate-protein phosphotransferase (PTS system enzyme I)
MLETEMQVLQGMGVSDGIAIGRAVCIETRGPDVYRLHVPEDQVANEVARLHEGARHARTELERIRARAEEDLGGDLAAIFEAHVMLLSDRAFLGRVEERIRTHHVNAEWAVHKTAEELDDRFAHMDDAYLRERSEDLTDVSRHLLRSLQGIAHHELSSSSWPTT